MKESMNATLVLKFKNKSFEFPASWTAKGFANGVDLAERTFFSDDKEMLRAFSTSAMPKMDVFLNADRKVTCRVVFESETGELYPVKNLRKSGMD